MANPPRGALTAGNYRAGTASPRKARTTCQASPAPRLAGAYVLHPSPILRPEQGWWYLPKGVIQLPSAPQQSRRGRASDLADEVVTHRRSPLDTGRRAAVTARAIAYSAPRNCLMRRSSCPRAASGLRERLSGPTRTMRYPSCRRQSWTATIEPASYAKCGRVRADPTTPRTGAYGRRQQPI